MFDGLCARDDISPVCDRNHKKRLFEKYYSTDNFQFFYGPFKYKRGLPFNKFKAFKSIKETFS